MDADFRLRIESPSIRSQSSLSLSSVDEDFDSLEEEYAGYNNNINNNKDNRDQDYESEATIAMQANALAAAAAADSTGEGTTKSYIELQQEVESSFLQYALSIILGRALPDARDGLKPVHRRILYSMHQLSLLPNQPHRKCARVVGEVLGKYHPHGDMAVYDALVRMAQDFTTNVPLIDGHGNFGSVDADPAAAMRYTECRLTPLATQTLLADLQDDTVDYSANFDGNEVEPTVLPSRVPLLLLNGSSGIAVGMATNIPPHNLRELLAACQYLVSHRIDPTKYEIDDAHLFRLVPGPDFPTGASIMGTEGAHQLYATGNGGIVRRAVSHVEKLVAKTNHRAPRTAIIVTELPYQVNKAALLEKIATLVNEKKLEGIADLRDESDRDGIRVVLELKRDAVAAVVLANLYKKTPLQSTFSGNFLALLTTSTKAPTTPSAASAEDDDDSATDMEHHSSSSSTTTTMSLSPRRFALQEALDCFIDFRFVTIRRKTRFQLQKVRARSIIVQGLLIALEHVDAVIKIIRASPDTATARQTLMNPAGLLNLSQGQADAVLKLQLGQLTRLNKGKLENETVGC